jgi:putative inorganic carbon (HCO3(-)) transporter
MDSSKSAAPISFPRRLLELEAGVSLIAVLAGMASDRFVLGPVIVLVIFSIFQYVVAGSVRLSSPANLAIVILLSVSVVSLFITTTPDVTRLQLFRLVAGISHFASLYRWIRRRHAAARQPYLQLAMAAALLVVALSAYAVISVDWTWGKLPLPAQLYDSLSVLVTNSVHPNVLAGTLVLLIPFAVSLIFLHGQAVTWPLRLLGLFALSVGSLALVLSQSRGALIALAIAAALVLFWGWRSGRIAMLLTAIIVAAVGLYYFGNSSHPSVIFLSALNSGQNRIEIWARTLLLLQDFPITGIGLGQFGIAVDQLYPFIDVEPGVVVHAHNLFLQVAADLGLVGLIGWLGIYILALAAPLRAYRLRLDDQNSLFILAVLAGMIALGIHGFFDAVTWGMVRAAPFVWSLWAMAISMFWLTQFTPTLTPPTSNGHGRNRI